MVERLKQKGTLHSSSDLLKMCEKMKAIWTAQVFRQAGETLSGPGAIYIYNVFIMHNALTSVDKCDLIVKGYHDLCVREFCQQCLCESVTGQFSVMIRLLVIYLVKL